MLLYYTYMKRQNSMRIIAYSLHWKYKRCQNCSMHHIGQTV